MANPTVESLKVTSAKNPRVESLKAPAALGSGTWTYDRLKRSIDPIRLVADMTREPETRAFGEYSKFVDLIKRDTLLSHAVLAFEDKTTQVTFKNGSVVTFDRGNRS